MRILISNDDGYLAPGLQALADALAAIAEVVVVAPDSNRSGASNSLTLDRPLSLHKAANGFYYVNGTPTDCVHVALTGLMQERPDLVVSGINNGPNMGDDTLYSGTVAAATEGYLFGIPAIAFSQSQFGWANLDAAARVGKRHSAEPVIRALDPRGREIFWIGPAGAAKEGGPGTDFYAVEHGQVSITPLQIDLTHTTELDALEKGLA